MGRSVLDGGTGEEVVKIGKGGCVDICTVLNGPDGERGGRTGGYQQKVIWLREKMRHKKRIRVKSIGSTKAEAGWESSQKWDTKLAYSRTEKGQGSESREGHARQIRTREKTDGAFG